MAPIAATGSSILSGQINMLESTDDSSSFYDNSTKIWKDFVDDDDDDSTEPLDSDPSVQGDGWDSDASSDLESFKTARSSISLLSDAANSTYEMPEQWGNDLPNEVQCNGDAERVKRKKRKKKKKIKQKHLLNEMNSSIISDGSSVMEGFSRRVLYSPPPRKSKKKLSKKNLYLSGQLNSSWGDLGSIKDPQHLTSCSLGAVDNPIADTETGWQDCSFSSFDNSLAIPSSQAADETWEDLFTAEIPNNHIDDTGGCRSHEEGHLWLTNLLGVDAVKKMDNENTSGNESMTGSTSHDEDSVSEYLGENQKQNYLESRLEDSVQLPLSFSTYADLLSARDSDSEISRAANEDPNYDDSGYTRSIRFADEQGLPLRKIHYLGGEDDPMAFRRLVVLLLSPTYKKFEFTHLEYCVSDGISVEDLLLQMPAFAASEIFAQTTYHSLHRTLESGGKKLDSTSMLHQCEFDNNEILIPAIENHKGEDLIHNAVPLLQNKRIMTMVRQAARTGRGIRYVQSRREFEASKDIEENKEEFSC